MAPVASPKTKIPTKPGKATASADGTTQTGGAPASPPENTVKQTFPKAEKPQIVTTADSTAVLQPSANTPVMPFDSDLFDQLQKTVRTGLRKMNKHRFEVEAALLEIQEKKLYIGRYKRYEDFCQQELNIAKAYAYSLASAAQVRRTLKSAMVDDKHLPANERQARPLSGLEPSQQPQVWKRVIELAAGKPISEAHVRAAVRELKKQSQLAPAKRVAKKQSTPDWKDGVIQTLEKSGYGKVFEQPFKWDADVVDLHSTATDRHIKLIERLGFEEAACALALKQKLPTSLIVIGADSNTTPDGLLFSKGKQPHIAPVSFPSAFHVMAKQLGAVIEYEGTFYQAGDLNDSFGATWTPASYSELGLPEAQDTSADGEQPIATSGDTAE